MAYATFTSAYFSLSGALQKRPGSKRCFVEMLCAPSRTQTIMEKIPSAAEAGGAGGASSYQALKRADEQWLRMRLDNSLTNTPEIVTRRNCPLHSSEFASSQTEFFDVVVCGGTLGIFIATVLALRGLRVAIVEKGPLQGRIQEWNISRKELLELVKAGILKKEEVDNCTAIDFNPNRCQFNGGAEVWVNDILNLGVSPMRMLDTLKQRFKQVGGQVFENSGLSNAVVFNDAVVITLNDGRSITSKLVLDAMGNFSPIVQQIRRGQPPDGVCLVVGTCARGFKLNRTSDIIFSNSPMVQVGDSKNQYFWEAFPAGSGPADRTIYLFTYADVTPSRPSLEKMLEDYWDLMPAYQVGDASGIQSPISFGGFGSITRHLLRLSNGIVEAIESDMLEKETLGLINSYMPNLSVAWMFQRAMSAQNNVDVSPNFINDLLALNFQCMERLGDPILRPFLQDVIQFDPLVKALGSIMLAQPGIVPSIIKQVGIKTLLDWSRHFLALGVYTYLSQIVTPQIASWIAKLPRKQRYIWHRRIEAWEYGSGLDFKYHI
ncbi:hypothetical protein O6H91_16G001100 [Diphasiastrum complanatum]|uniref:Uncharacterized protein n=1 Tax=Diphasiastrum complanatum TaxID=34168 RepID=A0ACC2B993_DIPCM|nr:hypothetical protein O6H91_16G001100 [Diphasiastrum complanatum]